MLIEFLTLVVLLPLLASYLPQSFRLLRSFRKDQRIAQWSIVVLAIGSVCLGIAPRISIAVLGIVIFALGSGQDSLLRSMATDLGSSSDVSTIYSAITMMRALGGSSSGPIYAGLYGAGLRRDRPGLPFVFAGFFFVIALLLSTAITHTKTVENRSVLTTADNEVEPLLS